MPDRTRLSILLVASLCAWILHAQTTTAAGGESWEQSLRRAQQLRDPGDYAEAGEVLRQALPEAGGAAADDAGIAMTLKNLGSLYRDQGQWAELDCALEEAVSLAEETLKVLESSSNPKSASMVRALNDEGVLYARLGSPDRAERLDQRARLILEQSAETALLDKTVSVSDLRKSKGRP
jgi:tetratricopeptide (TPR) repeat protein